MVQALWKVGGWWQGSQNHQGQAPLVPDPRSADGDRQLRGNGKVKKTTGFGTWSMEILWDFHRFPSCGSVHFNDGRIPQLVAILMRPGTPYMLYKDHCNRKSNQQNLGSWDQFGGRGPPFPVEKYPHGPMVYTWVYYVAHNVKYPLRNLGFVLRTFHSWSPLEVFS